MARSPAGVVEFTFCKLCRVNHNAGRKHIFTKKHKGRLAAVLSKFRTKVNERTGGLTDK